MGDSVKEDGYFEPHVIRRELEINKKYLTKSRESVKPPVEARRYLTRDEVHRLIDCIPAKRASHYVLFKMLWLTGLRITEALNVRKGDIDFEKGNLRVDQLKKRRKVTRWIPAHPDLVDLLKVYSAALNRDELLFKFSRQRAAQLCKKYRLSAGLDSWVHPHTFRHSFAVNFLEQSPHIGALQRQLGHENIRTTAEYLKVVNSDIRLELIRIQW